MDQILSDAVGAAAAELIKSCFSNITSGASIAIKTAWQRTFEDFDEYMTQCYKRNRFVRILCNGDSDVDLTEIYVGSTFRFQNVFYTDIELNFIISEGKNIVVCGDGGAGKTFFMKKLWLNLLKDSKRSPIFVELRKLNDLSKLDLISFLRNSISSKTGLASSVFESFCEKGRFVFILDGFDEVNENRHSELQNQITDIAMRFPDCSIVVSSRRNERFSGWSNFQSFDTQPFNLEQTTELCRKIPFDQNSKKVFIRKLTQDFFDQHSVFLSNPLLSVMMMMTFKTNMDIPRKISIFYEQAFNTLFQYHDSTKAFKREKSLDIHQFRNLFGTFALLTYFEETYEFSKSKIIEKIEQTKKMNNNFALNSEHILFDFEMAVNLIRQDGLKYVFIHRSFQEYFAADALTRGASSKFGELIHRLEARVYDNVLKFCFESNRDLVVEKYIIPETDALKRSVFNRNRKKNNVFELLKILGVEIQVHFTHIDSTANDIRTDSSSVHMVSFALAAKPCLFLSAISRLMDQEKQFNILVGRKLFPTGFGLFEELGSLIGSNEIRNVSEVTLKFLEDGPALENFQPTNGADPLVPNLVKVPDDSQLFIALKSAALEIQEQVRLIEKWCNAEILAFKKKDASIAEIFGLSEL